MSRNTLDAGVALQLLLNSTTPTLPSTPGELTWEVTPEEAAQLHCLVNAPYGSPGTLSRGLRPMASGDSALADSGAVGFR